MKDAEDVLCLYDLICRSSAGKRESLERYLKIKKIHDETEEEAPWIWDDPEPEKIGRTPIPEV